MAIEDDFSIAANGDIRHDSGSTNYTALAFHRYLQAHADDEAAAGNDFMDITFSNSSDRSTDNIIGLNAPYNIDDTAAQFIYDGSISQAGGGTFYRGLVVVGDVVAGTELQIWQDEAIIASHWSTGKNIDAANSILNRVLVKTRDNGADIDGERIIVWAREFNDTYAEFSVTMGAGNNTAAIFTSDDLNNDTAEATVATWTTITNTEGYQNYDISADGTDEDWYSRWDYAARTAPEVYERTKWIQRRGTATNHHARLADLFRGITHEWPYDTQTTAFVEDNIVVWGVHITYTAQTVNLTVGEYLSFSGGAVGKLIWMDDGGATGSIVVMVEDAASIGTAETILGLTSAGDGTTGTITDDSQAGGSAVILADDDNGADGTLWVQLISGVAPSTNFTLYERGVTAIDKGLVNGSFTSRTISPEMVGTYTGSAFIGAFGVGVDPTDGIAADQFFDLQNDAISPPNNQVFTVFGLVSGDRVLVTNDATGLDYSQFTLATSLTGAAETECVITTTIDADTPQTGVLRIQTDALRYQYAPYNSWVTSTFQFTASESFSGDNATNPRNVFLGYIDLATATTEEAVTLTFDSPRTMFVRVREGTTGSPIKPFETTGVFGTGGGSATAIRTDDF